MSSTNLRHDIEHLEGEIEFITIVVVPLLVAGMTMLITYINRKQGIGQR